ncbi:TPA: hypothetical protein ACFKY6_08565 [Neisseria gonorrhoeae]
MPSEGSDGIFIERLSSTALHEGGLYSPVRGVRNLENSQAMPYIPTQGFILNISLRG